MEIKKGSIYAAAGSALYGLMPLVAKIFYDQGGTSLSLCLYGSLLSLPLLWVIVRYGLNESLRISRMELKKIAFLAQSNLFTQILLYTSYNYISSGTATTVHFIYPALVLAGCVILYKEEINRVQTICCVLCIVGILCFYTPEDRNNLLGLILALCSGVTNALYIIFLPRCGLGDMPLYKMRFYFNSIMAIEYMFINFAMGSFTVKLSLSAWGAVCLFSILFSVVAGSLFQQGVNLVGSQKASILSTFEPLSSIILGFIFFQEELNGKSITGISCILLAVILLTACDGKTGKKG